MVNSVVILQPPLTQLNSPYPSGAYLASFFRKASPSASVRWIDVSNLFFHHLFSSVGLTRLYSLCRETVPEIARDADSRCDGETAFQLRRFLSFEDRWVSWIDGIVSILCGGDRELCHAFVRSAWAPRGARMDAFLAELDSAPVADDARILATLAIEDLSDFIAIAFDAEFSLVKYAESIAASEPSFTKIEGSLSRPMVIHFLEPMLKTLWPTILSANQGEGKILFCLSVPFPGCLVNALAMARSLRHFFGDRAIISMGGGYVNTELRNCTSERFFSYIDHLSFDRGFGGYADFLSREAKGIHGSVNRIIRCPPEMAEYEDEITRTIVPDYADIDFSRYPRLVDNPNPMHRLWSDGSWIKAYLAHGCYWHRCSFCDVSLDYIQSYRTVNVRGLYAGLRLQAITKGVRGIHLVDEAAPPRALRDFALENLKADFIGAKTGEGGLLSFWGNIRFEKTFTRDLADFLAAGALVGVSGGIEIASPEGFKAVDKGIDLENLVAVCAAFKEAGVLVHAYLIYGYWNEDAQGVIDTMETMRQLFAEGLVDSAFWHKFVLTRHSRVYGEWKSGMHRAALRPVEKTGDFADNDLSFEGEENSRKYTLPLDAALQAWMAGDGFDTPVTEWFPFPMPEPRVGADLIGTYISVYEKKRDAEWDRPFDASAQYCWVGSRPVDNGQGLTWWHLGEEVDLFAEAPTRKAILGAVLVGMDPVADNGFLGSLKSEVFRALRRSGLCKIHPL